jgi:hypothetical protein
VTDESLGEIGPDQKVEASEIHEGQIPTVVHVKVQIEIIGQYPEVKNRLGQRVEFAPEKTLQNDPSETEEQIHD